jgi:hypothetical protein
MLRNYDTGWGELLCFVLAWVIAFGAVWLDHARQRQSPGQNRVADSGSRTPVNANFD